MSLSSTHGSTPTTSSLATQLPFSLLGPRGQGLFASLTFIWLIVLMLVGVGLPTVNAVFAGRPGYSVDRLIWNSVWFVLFATVLSVLLGSAIYIAPPEWLGQIPKLEVSAIVVCSWIGVAASGAAGLILGTQRFRLWGAIQFTGSACTLGSALPLISWLHLGLFGAVVAWIGGQLVILVLAVLALASDWRWPPRFDRPLMQETAWFGARANASGLVGTLNFRFDSLLVLYLAGAFVTGLYSVTVLLAQLTFLAPSALSSSVLPMLSGSSRDRAVILTNRTIRLSLAMGLTAALGIGIFGRLLLALFGSQFAQAWLTLLLLLPGVAAYSLCHVTSVYWDSYVRKPHVNLYIAGLSLLIDTVGVMLLVPWLNLAGAGAAASLGYLIAAGLSLTLYIAHSRATLWEACVVRPADIAWLSRTIGATIRQRLFAIVERHPVPSQVAR